MSLTTVIKEEQNVYSLELNNMRKNDVMNTLRENIPAVEDAIQKSGGWLTKAASLLGCSSLALAKFVAQSPELLEIYQDIKEKYLDIAEIKLLTLVKKGELEAIKYWLNNQGKKRGWGVKEEDSGNKGNTIIFNIEPAFTINDVKNQADERIKEIEAKEYIDVKIKDVTLQEQKKEEEIKETVPIDDRNGITKDFIDATNEENWDNTSNL